MALQLGDFRLLKMLGRGGMGEVWQAEHATHAVPVAIKVVTLKRAREERYHSAFRTEVQAMASLRHDGIATILDYGRAGEGAERSSQGRFAANAPFLAMELADGSLDRCRDHCPDWPSALSILRQILDALAHAHARRVIHRDIKPQNVLVFGGRGGAPRFKLTDFGIAHPLDDEETEDVASGTPKYMAPEQILGSFREQGPWTDLYAVGCVAHWLVGDRTPYESADSEVVLRGHLLEAIPELEPRFDTPAGLQDWLTILLAKDPVDRFQRAADARYYLDGLSQEIATRRTHRRVAGDPEDGNSSRATADTIMESRTGDTSRESAETVLNPTSGSMVGQRSARAEIQRGDISEASLSMLDQARRDFRIAARRETGAPRRSFAPPPCSTWSRDESATDAAPVPGVGIGLFGLRPIPMVDREDERNLIWEQLLCSARARQPHAVVLRGASGAGKSRLAGWMAERAEELGTARALRAGHSPMGGPTDGTGRMIASYLRTVGLPRHEVAQRMRQFMSPDGRGNEFDAMDVVALTDLAVGSGNWLRNAAPRERHTVVSRFLERVAWDRPIYLWLDDVQWGRETIELATHLLHETSIPMLIVVTVRSDLLPDLPHEANALRKLLAHPSAHDLSIGPLPPEDHRALVQKMLGLHSSIIDLVAERTEGNPLFAVQLIADWVEREHLVVGDDGFELAPTASSKLPDSIHNLWAGRVERAIARFIGRSTGIGSVDPVTVELSLCVAAALGHEIDFNEWFDACAQLGVDGSFRLIEELVKLGMTDRTEAGFRLSHGMLSESLLRRARERGSFAEVHRACARMFQTSRSGRQAALNIATHLLEAGEFGAALEPLLTAAEERARRGNFERALELDGRRDEVLQKLKAPPSDPRWAVGFLRRAHTLLMAGRYDESSEFIDRAATIAAQNGDRTLNADLLRAQVALARHQDRTAEAIELGREALALCEELGDSLKQSRCHKLLGECLRRQGEPERSIWHYEQSLALLDDDVDPFELAWAHVGLGTTQRQIGALQEARRHLEVGRELFDSIGSRLGLGNVQNELGEIARSLGEYQQAENHYREALSLAYRREYIDFPILSFNIAMTKLLRHDWVQAEVLFEEIWEAAPPPALAMFIYAALAGCSAGQQRLDVCLERFNAFEMLYQQFPIAEPDIAMTTLMVGQQLIATAPELAVRALHIAHDQYEKLGNDAQREIVAELLLTCPPAIASFEEE